MSKKQIYIPTFSNGEIPTQYTYTFHSGQVAEVREFLDIIEGNLSDDEELAEERLHIDYSYMSSSTIELIIRAKIALKITDIIERSFNNYKIPNLEEGIETEDGIYNFENPITLDVYNGLTSDIKHKETIYKIIEYLKLKILLDKEEVEIEEFIKLKEFEKFRILQKILYDDLLQLFLVR